MRFLFRSALLLCALAYTIQTSGATFYALGTDLPGDFPAGVSPNGSYVVTGRRVWTAATGYVDIAQQGEIYARAISNNGLVAGLWCGNNTASCYEGFRSPAGGPLVGIGAFDNESSDAFALTPDGSIVVGSASSAEGSRSVRWTSAGGLVNLGTLGPGPGGQDYARGVSDDASVIVGLSGEDNDTQAFRWTQAAGMVGLGDLPGGALSSRAEDVSGDGQVIVGIGMSAQGTEAFRWTEATGMTPLGDLPGGAFFSEAYATSGDGRTIVGQSAGALAGGTAFIWTPADGMRELQQVLQSQYGLSAALAGWTLTNAADISADGKTIVGYGNNPAGQREGFVVRIPEPATGVLGLLVLGLWLRVANDIRKPPA
jgi:probable HAF family extracellular repeat protein